MDHPTHRLGYGKRIVISGIKHIAPNKRAADVCSR